jgi:immunoglobulin-binding protein 1
MAEESRSIRSVYNDAEQKRHVIETHTFDRNSTAFQENILAALQLYEQCLHIADRISLFSPNESLEDIASADLQYLLLQYRLAELCMRVNSPNRKATLQRAQQSYESYLKQLDNYDMLSKSDAALLEQYQDSPTTFTTAASPDPA